MPTFGLSRVTAGRSLMVHASAATDNLALGLRWMMFFAGATLLVLATGYLVRQYRRGPANEALLELVEDLTTKLHTLTQEALLTVRSTSGGGKKAANNSLPPQLTRSPTRSSTRQDENDILVELATQLRAAPRRWTDADRGYMEHNLTLQRLGMLLHQYETLEARLRHLSNFSLWRSVFWRNKEARRIIGSRLERLRISNSTPLTSVLGAAEVDGTPRHELVAASTRTPE
jgi:hypothetical protein